MEHRMIDSGRPHSTTDALRVTDIAIVDSWLGDTDEGAFADIVTHVGVASTDDTDRLDAELLSLAATNRSAEARRRLIKFYAIFKIAETQRYHEFRGFPT
jgi:hypothetical protein